MNYLLDTHVFLWALSEPEKLSQKAIAVIQNPAHSVFVSAVSSVEITLKQSIGKLVVPTGLEAEIEVRGFQHLPFSYRHGERMRELPMHHQDPFDRMLLAQALEESLILVTHDKKMRLYPVKLLNC
jgi:PIN domain nuclease of toxin-antitoxin system